MSKKTMFVRPVPKNENRLSRLLCRILYGSVLIKKERVAAKKTQKSLYVKPKVKEACRKSCNPHPLPLS